MSETDSDPERAGLSINHNKTLVQKESLTITSERGTGTRDEDKVRKFIEREAEVAVDDESELPSLITPDEESEAVDDVASVMEEVRSVQPDADDK